MIKTFLSRANLLNLQNVINREKPKKESNKKVELGKIEEHQQVSSVVNLIIIFKF